MQLSFVSLILAASLPVVACAQSQGYCTDQLSQESATQYFCTQPYSGSAQYITDTDSVFSQFNNGGLSPDDGYVDGGFYDFTLFNPKVTIVQVPLDQLSSYMTWSGADLKGIATDPVGNTYAFFGAISPTSQAYADQAGSDNDDGSGTPQLEAPPS